jgi:hypothetical protein
LAAAFLFFPALSPSPSLSLSSDMMTPSNAATNQRTYTPNNQGAVVAAAAAKQVRTFVCRPSLSVYTVMIGFVIVFSDALFVAASSPA